MGRRGPRPIPAELKILHGNPGKRRLPRRGAKPEPCSLTPPRIVRGRARSEWKRVAPELLRLGLLSKLDRSVLVAYCQAWADLAWAIETIRTQGRTATGPNGTLTKHPAVAIQAQAVAHIKTLGAELGLSPSARSSLDLDPVPDGKGTDGWFGGPARPA